MTPADSRTPASELRAPHTGVGRGTSRRAERVSDDLRFGAGSWLEQRRSVSRASLVAMAALAVVNAYQTGLIRRPPEPRLPLLDAARVDGAGEAYEMFKTPDAALGLVSYALTLVLAGMGDRRRSETAPWIPLALLGKVVLDAGSGLFLTAEQATKHRRFCSWCLVAAAASVAMVPRAWPEGVAAWRHLRQR